jgi:serine/threonine protein phosphatase 1
MKTFVIGDIHGAHQALMQCFERSGFNRENDRLIVLGDVCDVYPEVRECFNEILAIKHCVYILGNHDLWALDWAQCGAKPDVWIDEGGDSTIQSYNGGPMLPRHADFLNTARLWLEEDGRVFIHAGFDPRVPLKEQRIRRLVSDRDMIHAAWKKYNAGEEFKFGVYEEIFLGHTSTLTFQSDVPLHMGNVWALDTGAGWAGKLTIMDVQTKQYWQSDKTADIYDGRGRLIKSVPCEKS